MARYRTVLTYDRSAAQDAVELEPFREEAHRRLMLIHEASGNRAEALRAYARLHALLEAELGTRPSPATRSLYDALA